MKFIEKILDKYFARKLVDEIKFFLAKYNIDKKVVYDKYGVQFLIKNKKYNENYYKTIIDLPYKECCYCFINEIDKIKESVKDIIGRGV